MLILGRKEGEEICIGDDIIVKLLEIKGSEIKLGITAPQSVVIVRSEIRDGQRKLRNDHRGGPMAADDPPMVG